MDNKHITRRSIGQLINKAKKDWSHLLIAHVLGVRQNWSKY
jgi:hypothetical protein